MLPNMRKASLLLLFSLLGISGVLAKESHASSSLTITREGGVIEDYISSPLDTTFYLGPNDSAILWTNGSTGEDGWYSTHNVYLFRDQVMVQVTGLMGFYDVTRAGQYSTASWDFTWFFPCLFTIVHAEEPPLLLNVKVWLQGAYDPNSGMMRDDLREAWPYQSYFSDHTTSNWALLAIEGPDAIVDRVSVELRSSGSPQNVSDIEFGLLQRDGDIVGGDGTSPLAFPLPPGDYFIVVGHRNHLRAMTAAVISLDTLSTTVDFRDPGLQTYGTDARKIEGSAALLWAGKVANHSTSISYTGNSNDRDAILQSVGTDPTHTLHTFSNADVNMDGIVKYTGADNDRDIILLNLGSDLATGVREEQVP